MPTDDRTARAWAIVREVAATEFVLAERYGGFKACRFCDGIATGNDLYDETVVVAHAPTCIWAEARRLVEETA